MAGSGKSTIGRLLARRLRRDFIDVDRAIEESAGTSIEQIFADGGEPLFRDNETLVLREALEHGDPQVVSTGGGVVVTAENRRMLRSRSVCVWLRAEADTLVERLVLSPVRRPLVDGDVAQNVRRLLEERTGYYEELADITCDVDHRRPHVIVDEICAGIS